jgi:hypothetical protein
MASLTAVEAQALRDQALALRSVTFATTPRNTSDSNNFLLSYFARG